MSTEKTKKTGKIIIVILGVAILFFLLLPFLEEENASANAEAKKATPQIFTSNPLSDLVRKVYAMFSRGQNRQQHPAIENSVLQEENFLAQAPTQDQRFSAAHETNDFSSTVNTNYGDYGPAGFINENGEWVMVQQTAPDVAQPGMHEVNVSDNAYDKYVRLERAAKYTGSSTTTTEQIPDSKWARLWKPIKKLFGADKEDKNTISPTHTDKSFALAAANSKNSQTTRTPSERFKRALEPSLKNIPSNLPIIDGQPTPILDMLNPQAAVRETANNLKKAAREMLDPKTAADMEKEIDQNFQQVLQSINTELENDLRQQAEGIEDEDIIAHTLAHCGEDPLSPFYSPAKTTPSGGCTYVSMQNNSSLQETLQSQTGNEQLAAYLASADIPVITVLQVTQPGNNPTQKAPILNQEGDPMSQQEIETLSATLAQKCSGTCDAMDKDGLRKVVLHEVVDILFQKEQCDQKPCMWVSYGKNIKDLITTAGLTYANPTADYNSKNVQQALEIVQQNWKQKLPGVNLENIYNEIKNSFDKGNAPINAERFTEILNNDFPADEKHAPYYISTPNPKTGVQTLEAAKVPAYTIIPDNKDNKLPDQQIPQEIAELQADLEFDFGPSNVDVAPAPSQGVYVQVSEDLEYQGQIYNEQNTNDQKVHQLQTALTSTAKNTANRTDEKLKEATQNAYKGIYTKAGWQKAAEKQQLP